MRVLLSFVGGTGHFLPTVPIARVLAARGHEVRYACQPRMLAAVRAAGFAAEDSGGATLADPAARSPLVPVDRGREQRALRDSFAGRLAAERAERLAGLAGAADVLVHDEIDFGAAVAARALGLPHVAVVVTAAGGFVTPRLVGDGLRTLCGPHVDVPALLAGDLTVAPFMPSFRDPAHPLPATTCFVRPDVPADLITGDSALRIYITLGTIFHQESGDLFGRLLEAVRALPAEVLVTVGREIDPAELGPQPANVRVERFVPTALAVPSRGVVVCHGGSGTTIAALARGVPLVLLPLGADQPWNADRCAALGVARVLDPVTATVAEIRAAVTGVLGDRGYRRRAAALRDAAAALPGPDEAARRIEALAG